MRYQGGKVRLSKYIAPIIKRMRQTGQWYVEPFVGGGNMFHLIDGPKIGNDLHPAAVGLLRAIADGWEPPSTCGKEHYEFVKANQHAYPDYYLGFVGFGCSFGGNYFDSYAVDTRGGGVNFAKVALTALNKQRPGLQGAWYYNLPYDQVPIPPNSLIYCDPPYANTKKYKTDKFNHEQFWQWCDDMVSDGHKVLVSELTAPAGWVPIWQNDHTYSMSHKGGHKKIVEKLFTKG